MPANVNDTTLMKFLKTKDSPYHGKAGELREAIKKWLVYIPSTFPHYTLHTIEHSEEIISQLSKLLFRDEDPSQPVVSITPTEAYILIAASYLHDAGMVVSDKEKAEILASDTWKNWTTGQGGGAKRYAEVEKFRREEQPADEGLRFFLADVQVRFLIAEFIRRVHHMRAGSVLTQHQQTLGRFAYDDPMLLNAISNVCISHGLRPYELRDTDRFPEQRDIQGDAVNVRFLAILLRLGDLLDLSYDRACPLLLNAACPLPPDSLAHWSQYQRITHRLTVPDKIEITAECQTQEEHRVLQDWCQWLADELREARNLMAFARRHRNWVPPHADMEETSSTIRIRPATGAKYLPHRWTFELDHEAVFQRLIKDAYSDPNTFVRELIQNALDANRCQMYADYAKEGKPAPEYPTQFPEDIRNRYPVKITLSTKSVVNNLSGETEDRQILAVEDCGIGMDSEIIQHYFLQVGRSFYTTDEFRRSFSFTPTSRFGIGFLSVFAISDRVTVETHKPSSPHSNGPIRLTLTGPRNYLLTDHGTRRACGTCVEVLLRTPLEPGKLTSLVRNWCRRVEFPVQVEDLGTQTTVLAERTEQFIYEMPDLTHKGAMFKIRAFPVRKPGIEGELYILTRTDEVGEAWDLNFWHFSSSTRRHPGAAELRGPGRLTCLHGIAVNHDEPAYGAQMSYRIDYRRAADCITLSREGRSKWDFVACSDLRSCWEEILDEHLRSSARAKGLDAWKYKHRLAKQFPIGDYWDKVPGMIPVFRDGRQEYVSVDDTRKWKEFTLITNCSGSSVDEQPQLIHSTAPLPAIILPDERDSSPYYRDRNCRDRILENRYPHETRWLDEKFLEVRWALHTDKPSPFYAHERGYWVAHLIEIPDSPTIGCLSHRLNDLTGFFLLNCLAPFTKWVIRVYEACVTRNCGLEERQFRTLLEHLTNIMANNYMSTTTDLNEFLRNWRQLPGLSPDLLPPEIELSQEHFKLRRGKSQ